MCVSYTYIEPRIAFVHINDATTLEELPICYRSTTTIVSLTYSTDNKIFPNFPLNMVSLEIHDLRHPLEYLTLPKTLTSLCFKRAYEHPITIPDNITTFEMPTNYKHPIVLHSNIKTFVVDNDLAHPLIITGSYPKRVQSFGIFNISKHMRESPILYYLSNYFPTYHPTNAFYHSKYVKDVYRRASINRNNNDKRRQGLFDTMLD